MATVDKNFKVKNGLIVEGTTATVNGEDVITTGSNTDSLAEGSTNLYYTTARAKGDAADLLVNATKTNITITGNEDGLTITAENGGIQDLTGFDTDDLTEGTTNLYFTNQRAIDAGDGVFDGFGAASTVAGNLTTHESDTSTHGVTGNIVGTSDTQTLTNKTVSDSLHFQDGINNYSAIYASVDDLRIDGSDDIVLTTNNGDIILNADGTSYLGSTASGNEIATRGYADGLASNYDPAGSAAAAQTAAESYADSAVSALVNGAPALLDTLNELAAAINDDASFASTIATQIGEKQNTLTAGSGISIVSDTISVSGLSSTDISDFSTAALSATASAYDTAGAASSAETAANGYTDTAISGLSSVYEPIGAAATAVGALDTDDIEEGATNLYFTNQRAIDAVGGTIESAIDLIDTDQIEEGSTNLYFTDARAQGAINETTPNFAAVEIATVAKQVAATSSSLGSVVVTAFSFAKSAYRTAKFIVKIDNGTDNEVTEVLLTLDSSDNIAITEYAIVGTNGSRGTITADISGSNVRLLVDPVNDSTINVVGTLLV